jgi:release factor glutamine methyltransferase
MQNFEILSPEQMLEIDQRQVEQQRQWKAIPQAGIQVEFEQAELLVMPGVFPPRTETRLLIEFLPLRQDNLVLDLGTGTGALAIWAARNGAGKVIATDIAGAATYNARQNVQRLQLNKQVEVRSGHMFSCISRLERFELILANLPGRNKIAADDMAAAHWDTEFKAHHALFEGAREHLHPDGGIYMAKANYPDLPVTVELAAAHGFNAEVIGQSEVVADDPRTYYVLKFSI